MKKLMIIFSICTIAVSTAFSQDDTYYTGDESTVAVQTQEAPPELPTYVQPPCPADGYIWTPGYWAWGTGGYYWVPGVWVMPPSVGLLWTPGYWGFYGGHYGWHRGYWGTTIGYYGGVNYGFGYYGSGFYGGRWEGGHFMYNSAVWHVGGGFHNVYSDRSVIVHGSMRASYNGPGGVRYRPNNVEMGAMHANHVQPTAVHAAHETNMGAERGQFHSTNARPAVHSMSTPGGQRFNQRGRSIGGGAPHGGGGSGSHGGGGGRR
jgi:uncharacterized membrane protein YgcG